MKTKLTILVLLYAAVYLFGLLAINAQVGIPQQTIYKKIEIPIEKIVYKEVAVKITRRNSFDYSRYDLIQQALTAAENSGEYKAGVYDCSQFSRALVHELANRGLWGTLTYGYDLAGNPHVWVGIQVEPMENHFLSPNAYKLDPQVGIWDKDQNLQE